MDFGLGEDLETVQDLARGVFARKADPIRVRLVEDGPSGVDDLLWAELATTGLLGVALPDEHGGAGLGIAALALVLEEQGRCVAPVPLWSAGVAALAVARHGDYEQRTRLLPGFVAGSTRPALAIEEYADARPGSPACTATPDGVRWRLNGVKAVVPSPRGADYVVVSATAPAGPGLFLVPAGSGLSWELSQVTSRDLAGDLVLDGVSADALGDPGGPGLADLLRLSAVALASLQIGVADGALELASSYLRQRHQFGRPLGSFQAVQHQLADSWIEIEAMRLTRWQAVASIADDDPAADRSALVAKWWCDQAGLDVVHRIQHLHGGIGVDVDYPVHRHFLWGKQLATTLGGSGSALADLGDLLGAQEIRS